MRIGIDARCLQQGLGGGTARVLYSLLKQWASAGQANEYILYFDDLDELMFDLNVLGQNFIFRDVRMPKMLKRFLKVGLIWQQVILPLRLLRDKVDFFFSPYYSIPIFYLGKKCVVVHDISYHTLKDEYPKKDVLSDIISRLSCILASKVITDSETSKQEIIKHYNIPADKISVIHCGIDIPEKMTGASARFITIPNVRKGQYALYVGTMFKRRHVVELIKAWDARLAVSKTTALVLLGKNAIMPRIDLREMIEEVNARHGGQYILHYDHVNDDELNALYAGCAVFIYPSTYEGFGLPPLEAMLHNKPVIVGNADVFQEIIGQAAMIIDPEKQGQILDAVDKALNNAALRAELISNGKRVVENLKWAKAAKLYLERFSECFAQKGSR